MMQIKDVLANKGVRLISPETITFDPDVRPESFAPGTEIYPGCRLRGEQISVGPGCVIGAEAPVTLDNCQLGERVRLAGGYFEKSTFLNDFRAGNSSHVRPGCLFEEGSSIAHCVGTKQTLFLPWVTAGSQITLCDCLAAGGISRKNHTEIGSSYVHFNFTPYQDKATPSMIGDIPRGVMLNQQSIFLGGQGGMVGPSSLAFGTVIPAGQIWRGDHCKPNQIVLRKSVNYNVSLPFDAERYKGIGRVVSSNLRYIGNLVALDQWYRVVRSCFMVDDPWQQQCFNGARQRLREMFTERLKQMNRLALNVEKSLALPCGNPFRDEHREFLKRWESRHGRLEELTDSEENLAIPENVQAIVATLRDDNTKSYIEAVQGLAPEPAAELTAWLDSYVQTVMAVLEDS
ncbi:MAG: UDP-N-acetylglucosamine pyrophosphorylase [Kiritimatiellae bacterium]|nr:UDP-N-acetylglucosamine pyrophosphorylase [Kiritimatiellia bacterium]